MTPGTEAGRRHIFLSGSNPERRRIAIATVEAIEEEMREKVHALEGEACNRLVATAKSNLLADLTRQIEGLTPRPNLQGSPVNAYCMALEAVLRLLRDAEAARL